VTGVPAAAVAAAAATTTTAGARTFDHFYDENLASLVRLGWALTGSFALGEELAQEAMITAHRRWPAISRYERPDAWVRRVLTNRARSAMRRHLAEARAYYRARDGDGAGVLPPGDGLPDEELWHAVRSLPPHQVAVVALRYVDAMTTAEIAAVLDCTEATVRSHLARAHAALQRRLSDGSSHEPR
jgi:RNA polymerase sigma factor (sigma-70 family)